MNTTLYTVGHSNRSLDELIAVLRSRSIVRLLDVRSWPVSRRHPQFNRQALEQALGHAGIGYHYEGRDLGGRRQAPTPDCERHMRLDHPGYRAYAVHMQTDRFGRALERVLDVAADGATALMCAERDPAHCHRSLIADRLVLAGHTVIHLVEADTHRRHRVHPGARWTGSEIIYDRDGQLGFEGV